MENNGNNQLTTQPQYQRDINEKIAARQRELEMQFEEEARRQATLRNTGLSVWNDANALAHNFDGSELEKFQQQMLCMNDAKPGADFLNRKIMLKYWLAHEITIMKEGTPIRCCRVVMVTPDGDRIAFVSDVVARGLREIVKMFGHQDGQLIPINPPLAIEVRQKALKDGKRCYVLVPIVPEAPKVESKK